MNNLSPAANHWFNKMDMLTGPLKLRLDGNVIKKILKEENLPFSEMDAVLKAFNTLQEELDQLKMTMEINRRANQE